MQRLDIGCMLYFVRKRKDPLSQSGSERKIELWRLNVGYDLHDKY